MTHSECPLDEWLQDTGNEEALCWICQTPIADTVCILEDQTLCEECAQEVISNQEAEAAEFASEHCKILRPLPEFNKAKEWACTPEQYAAGDKECYSENSYRTLCRHEFTNYDELISSLSRESGVDGVFYTALRICIDEMIQAEIKERDLIVYEDGLDDSTVADAADADLPSE